MTWGWESVHCDRGQGSVHCDRGIGGVYTVTGG